MGLRLTRRADDQGDRTPGDAQQRRVRRAAGGRTPGAATAAAARNRAWRGCPTRLDQVPGPASEERREHEPGKRERVERDDRPLPARGAANTIGQCGPERPLLEQQGRAQQRADRTPVVAFGAQARARSTARTRSCPPDGTTRPAPTRRRRERDLAGTRSACVASRATARARDEQDREQAHDRFGRTEDEEHRRTAVREEVVAEQVEVVADRGRTVRAESEVPACTDTRCDRRAARTCGTRRRWRSNGPRAAPSRGPAGSPTPSALSIHGTITIRVSSTSPAPTRVRTSAPPHTARRDRPAASTPGEGSGRSGFTVSRSAAIRPI